MKALDNLTGILIDRTYNRKETIYEKQGRIIRVKNGEKRVINKRKKR